MGRTWRQRASRRLPTRSRGKSRIGIAVREETFDARWLELREPADHRSRCRALVTSLRREGRRRKWSRMVDLGSGTGSNVRYLGARIPWATEWTVVDHDPALLERVSVPWRGHTLRRVVGDLSREGLEAVAASHVVTASALLDLVSERWLGDLREACVARGAAAYFALSYDGEVEWAEQDEDDALVREAVNEHQRADKGLGVALGPAATDAARALFEEAGYDTRVGSSPWLLSASRDAPLMVALAEGWVRSATEARPTEEDRIRRWRRRRLAAIGEGRAGVRVGHLDILALPSD